MTPNENERPDQPEPSPTTRQTLHITCKAPDRFSAIIAQSAGRKPDPRRECRFIIERLEEPLVHGDQTQIELRIRCSADEARTLLYDVADFLSDDRLAALAVNDPHHRADDGTLFR
jgi:hypothetical protein